MRPYQARRNRAPAAGYSHPTQQFAPATPWPQYSSRYNTTAAAPAPIRSNTIHEARQQQGGGYYITGGDQHGTTRHGGPSPTNPSKRTNPTKKDSSWWSTLQTHASTSIDIHEQAKKQLLEEERTAQEWLSKTPQQRLEESRKNSRFSWSDFLIDVVKTSLKPPQSREDVFKNQQIEREKRTILARRPRDYPNLIRRKAVLRELKYGSGSGSGAGTTTTSNRHRDRDR